MLHHGFELQLVGAALRQGEADQTAAVLGHEVYGVGRRHLRRDDEIAFVLAIGSIDKHDHAAVAQVFDDLGRRCQISARRAACVPPARRRRFPRRCGLDRRCLGRFGLGAGFPCSRLFRHALFSRSFAHGRNSIRRAT